MLGIPHTINQVAELCLARDLFQGFPHSPPIKYISFDTRTISRGSETLFVALSTSHRDGHDFLADAYRKGVRNFIVDRNIPYRQSNYALVDHTLEALQLWAMHHRGKCNYPVIGITGSNGKTTVKEWLATLLEWEFDVVKSPLSYNSQIGVPISVLQMRPQASCAIIEAGISQPGEMEILAGIIQPTIGILTHMGDAHNNSFDSFEQKLTEKCALFSQVSTLICGSWQAPVWEYVQNQFPEVLGVGEKETDKLQVFSIEEAHSVQVLKLRTQDSQHQIHLPSGGNAARENFSLAVLAARELGLSWESVQSQAGKLFPVHMRCEIITDNPDITLINDSYNSDLESVRTAFHLLNSIEAQPEKILILTDLQHLGENALAFHRDIYQEAITLFGEAKVITVGPIFGQIHTKHHYPDTNSLLKAIRYSDFLHHTLLLKGARNFKLERLLPLLNKKLNATYFRIDLDGLVHNFKTLCARVPEGTKTMCVVKASSYGNGTWEIARELEAAGADYLAVAYTSEGIALRESQIHLPIMVMNPDIDSIPGLLQYQLEPEVSNFQFLNAYIQLARLSEGQVYPIHLKLETGMGRLGFVQEELGQLGQILAGEPLIQVVSLMSHLVAADNPDEDDFSHEQARRFFQMSSFLQQEMGISPLRHLLNSKGVLRFPEYACEMVRLGAGLYGINTTDVESDLEEIGGLYSTISQIRDHPEGVSIGYGRAEYTRQASRIATIALGYADGVPRNLGVGCYAFLVRGKKAPIFGRVCMDMTMIDVTDIPEAQAGDEVVIFGRMGDHFLSVEEMAQKAQTIPYEILVRISPRVRRIYMKGG